MKTLALETATNAASVAIWNGEKIFSAHCDPNQPHSATFLPAVENLLTESKITRAEINAIAVDIGPGAFTGLRHGVATAQAFALALDLPIFGVSSLKTLAFSVLEKSENAQILATLDARMNEIYCAVFHENLQEISAPFLCAVDALPDLDFSKKIVAVGNVDKNYPQFVANLKSKNVAFFSEIPRAENVARLAIQNAAQEFTAQTIAPFYVRNKVAETSAERAAKGFKI